MHAFVKLSLLFLFVACFHLAAQAQTGKGKISGLVVDSTDMKPVSFATVTLTLAGSQKPVNGAVADEKGQFSITKIAVGEYNVAISFIGYKTVSKSVTIGEKNDNINLGKVFVFPAVTELKEVTVEGKKDLIEEKVDRTIYNADQDATSKGGDATDVLRRVPMLTVDLDGNVSLRGNQNIRVLINNKPSTIMATSIADALKQIPADQIKSVEVITSPSAKYDAEGSAGIINIITKKTTMEGLTLGINSSVGYRGSMLGLNGAFRRGKIGFSLGGHGRSEYNVVGNFENTQKTTNTLGNELQTIQSADTRRSGLWGRYTLGFDYDINKYNSLAASVQFGVRNNRNFQDGLLARTFQNSNLLSTSLRNVDVKDLSNNVDVSVTYTRTFEKPQKELSVLALFSRNNRNNDFINAIMNPASSSETISRLKNLNDSYNQESTIQIDYQSPIGKTQIIEFGGKQIMRQVTSDFKYYSAQGSSGDFVVNSNAQLSNALNYNQNVTAAYLSYTYTTKNNYSIKVGSRYEYTNIQANLQNEQKIDIPDYGVMVPSLNLSKKFKKGDILKLSYNRRIQRPSLQFLNPNIQAANPLNITIGNPSLNPEYTNNFELGYSTYVKGIAINAATFVRNTNNAIQSVRDIVGRDTIRTTYQNIGREDSYGLNLNLNINMGKLNIGTGGDIFYAVLKNNVPNPLYNASNEGWVYNLRLFGNYTMGNGWGLQSFAFYRGRQVQLQGVQGGFGMYSIALNKDFKSKKGSVGFGIENFFNFNGITIRSELNSPVISQQSVNVNQNLSFRINFNYRIGKMSFDTPTRRKKSINNDDMKGEGGGEGGGGEGVQQGGGQRQPAQGTGGKPAQQGGKPVQKPKDGEKPKTGN
ncbi:MAG: TonB-dependent receptor [Cytophagales bacterium]|nr:MAG: TonB-dependent receptor [Cytophagales bacterium]